jgi:hypothetical protein
MAITTTIRVAAGVFAPGHPGELTRLIPFEFVDSVLEETRTRERRLRVPGSGCVSCQPGAGPGRTDRCPRPAQPPATEETLRHRAVTASASWRSVMTRPLMREMSE